MHCLIEPFTVLQEIMSYMSMVVGFACAGMAAQKG